MNHLMIIEFLQHCKRNLICHKCKKPIDEIIQDTDPCKAEFVYLLKCHGEEEIYRIPRYFLAEHSPSELKFDYVFKPKAQITSSKPSTTPQ